MVSLVVAAWPPLLHMSGVALQDGSPMILPVLFVNGFLFGALGIAPSILAGSMIADCVEDSQRKTGRRSEGLLFAANSLIGKVVSGFGVFGAGIVLSLVEFPEQIEPAKVPVATVNQMFLTYIAVVGVLYLVGVTLLSRCRITRATHARNVEALSENGGPK